MRYASRFGNFRNTRIRAAMSQIDGFGIDFILPKLVLLAQKGVDVQVIMGMKSQFIGDENPYNRGNYWRSVVVANGVRDWIGLAVYCPGNYSMGIHSKYMLIESGPEDLDEVIVVAGSTNWGEGALKQSHQQGMVLESHLALYNDDDVFREYESNWIVLCRGVRVDNPYEPTGKFDRCDGSEGGTIHPATQAPRSTTQRRRAQCKQCKPGPRGGVWNRS